MSQCHKRLIYGEAGPEEVVAPQQVLRLESFFFLSFFLLSCLSTRQIIHSIETVFVLLFF